GDAHCLVGDLNIKRGALDEASEAWLCALTAFEVARRLVHEDDPESGDVSAKVEAGIQRFGSLERKVERVEIACCDHTELRACYLPAGNPNLCTPAVICISREEESGAALLGRLLPVATDRGISVLVVSHDDVSNQWCGQSEMLLSCCLDYLSDRPEVDATRIGVYGEGLSAALATDFAISDRRIAAAVCDGGLWNWARTLASVGWMTGSADAVDENVASEHRLRSVRQLRCPVLVVAGGRGTVSVPEAIKLQADCSAVRIDLELAMPPLTRAPVGEIENFVVSDERIFGWLEDKLAHASAR
ncbi:S9 family peptidase, partial [Bradyrhizobium sp. WSM2793]|uniref:alpha/beta hydrolase family protein n=1 Tax=Bradyrhizobium sp. WSM2793 TaxID=1038866 RepID=UPI00037E00AD